MTRTKIKVADLVKEIMTNVAKTRDSDLLLYEFVMNANSISKKVSFDEVKTLIEDGKLPTFETVRRSRAKVQELFPELGPSEDVARLRGREISTYVEISRYDFSK